MKEKQDCEASKGTLGSPKRDYIGTFWTSPHNFLQKVRG